VHSAVEAAVAATVEAVAVGPPGGDRDGRGAVGGGEVVSVGEAGNIADLAEDAGGQDGPTPTMSTSRVWLAATSVAGCLASTRISPSSSRNRAMRRRATCALTAGTSASSRSAAAKDRWVVSRRQTPA
jgi:hypothetical protein